MTIPVDVVVLRLSTDGARKIFNLTGSAGALYFMSPSHLSAIHVASDGTETALTYGTDFTIGGDGRQGTGVLTTIAEAALSAGVLVVRRTTPRIQQSTWSEGDGNPSARFADVADYEMAGAQENAEAIDRAIRGRSSEEAMAELPPAAARAGRALVFDETGKNFTVPEDTYVDQLANVTAEADRAETEADAATGAAGTAAADTVAAAEALLQGKVDAATAAAETAVEAEASTAENVAMLAAAEALLESILSRGIVTAIIVPSKVISSTPYICVLGDYGFTLQIDASGGARTVILPIALGSPAANYWVKLKRYLGDETNNQIIATDLAGHLIGQIILPNTGRNVPTLICSTDGTDATSDGPPQ